MGAGGRGRRQIEGCADAVGEGRDAERPARIDLDDGTESEGLSEFGELVEGHFLEHVSGVVARSAGSVGEAAGSFVERDAAVDFDGAGVG